MEQAYKTMSRIGAGSIAVGIVVAVVGVAAGVVTIVSGAKLLKRKNELTF